MHEVVQLTSGNEKIVHLQPLGTFSTNILSIKLKFSAFSQTLCEGHKL